MCHAITNSGSTVVDREILPEDIKPVNYNLTLEPDFTTFTYDGEEIITLEVLEKTDLITLNTLEIDYKQVKVNDIEIESKDFKFDDHKQRVTFQLPDHLVKGATAKLYIKFKGILNDDMAGFYKSTYVENGETKYLATTQFEPIDARRAFPSFDEPALKATFDISLIAHKDLTALSNLDEKETTLLDNDRKKVTFNTTPIMSTYLVAFIVGDLRYIENNDYKVPIRVYSTPGSEHLGHYAAEVSAKTLQFFDEKFEIPYPLPKCDLVAIHDFAAGAMENYGLITFRTVEVLIDPKEANIGTLKRVTEVVQHELAHQWFGNLVTMDFWDGLWLNEGFATWMSWYACDAFNPDWKVWESYVTDDLQQALSLDSLRSSHPIEVPLKRANDVNQIFDSISYAKGSSLLKMIANWLGEATFVKGVSNYLKKHKWGNTKTSDLWDALAEASGKPVQDVMDIWTKNVGFPLVSVKELGNNELEITQHRFLNTGDATEEEDKVIFPVFLSIKTSKGVDHSVVLDSRSKIIKIDADDDFFKINADQSGIYRTSYSTERWAKLGKAALDGKLSVEDRAGLVADASALVSPGVISASNLLDLIKPWGKEPSYVVWDQIGSAFGFLTAVTKFEEPELKDALDAFRFELISSKLNEYGYDFSSEDTFAESNLKGFLFGTAVGSSNKKYVEIAQEKFAKYVKGEKSEIHSNIRGYIFNSVAKHGDKTTWDELYKIFTTSPVVEEQLAALRALGAFRDEKLLDKTIELLFKFDIIKKQDTYKPLITMTSNPKGIEKVWEWFTSNYDKITEAHPPQLSMFGTLVTLAVRGFTKQEQKDKVVKFFEDKDTTFFNQNLNQALDTVTSRINWLSRDLDSVREWVSANGYSKSKL